MTKEQAIKFANCLKNNYTIDFDDMADFCDIAIKALEQQTIAEERYQDLVDYFGDKDVAKCILEDRNEFKKWLERIKWHVRKADELARKLEQQPSDDCVSRQAVLELAQTIETDDYSGNELLDVVDVEDIKSLPPVTPTQSWVSIKDYGFPSPKDERKQFFVTDDCGEVSIQTFYLTIDEPEKQQPYFSGMKNVIAYMPLPKPYEEKRGSENGSN